ncbi:GntR family transcriptional regulator [Thermosyntropha sp.]|uniref:GntR family transcriptional regulator n=1 Tax=Thermosyntropha sp. TaxID=2740820 RepID=UPI0025F82AD5|nr:GntR family transcriptional regulator [Thermosyntropha sp.]MBO8158165.1 GntR family transcriptional regulator [Thermosyntropha sp.]
MRIIISNSSPEPIYEQIARQIKDMIMRGELSPNELLPSIRNLAKELKISVITTKRAYQELENEGYIVTVPGKGCFVAAQNKEILRERYLRIVEEKFTEAIEAARVINLTLDELKEILKLLYEEV